MWYPMPAKLWPDQCLEDHQHRTQFICLRWVQPFAKSDRFLFPRYKRTGLLQLGDQCTGINQILPLCQRSRGTLWVLRYLPSTLSFSHLGCHRAPKDLCERTHFPNRSFTRRSPCNFGRTRYLEKPQPLTEWDLPLHLWATPYRWWSDVHPCVQFTYPIHPCHPLRRYCRSCPGICVWIQTRRQWSLVQEWRLRWPVHRVLERAIPEGKQPML